MSDADIIKEFLVAVGVKVDENSLSKFDGIIATIGGGVLKLAGILGTAAIATETFVDKVAGNLEDLYWASQRLHSGVAAIQDYALAIQNLGGTADGARSSLESIARTLRLNPGAGGFLNSLGINPGEGAVKIAKDLATKTKAAGLPYFIAARYAAVFGVDENTFWAEWNGKTSDLNKTPYADAYKNAGLSADDTAKKAHAFEVQLRDVGVQFNLLSVNMMTHLLPAAQALNRELLKTVPAGVRGANNIANSIGFQPTSSLTASEFADARKNSRELLPNLLKSAGKYFSGSKTSDVVNFFTSHGLSTAAASAIAAGVYAESGNNPKSKGDYVNGKPTALGLAQLHAPRQKEFKQWAGFDITDPRATFQKQLEFILFELTKGSDVGARKAGQLLGSGNLSAAQASDVFTKYFERPLNLERDAATRRGLATSIEINQKTEINIPAGPTATATANKTAAAQSRVNGDLARNLKGAVQ